MTPEAQIQAQRYKAMADAFLTLYQAARFPETVCPNEVKLAKDRIDVTLLLMRVAEGENVSSTTCARAFSDGQ